VITRIIITIQIIIIIGNSIACATNCNYRIAATLHALKAWFVSST
jgi:hypothetical protein